MVFSDRKKIAEDAEDWCDRHGCEPIPFNIVTALSALGMLTHRGVVDNGNTIPSSHFWTCRKCQKPVIVGDGIPSDELCFECKSTTS